MTLFGITPTNCKRSCTTAERWVRRVIAWTLRLAIRRARAAGDQSALYLLRRLANFAPRVSIVQVWLARVAVNLGDTPVANSALRAAIAGRSSNTCSCYWRVAQIQLIQGDLDAAEASLIVARQLFPESPRIWELHGELYRFRANTEEAVKCFEHALSLAATNEARVSALWGLAGCFVDAGRKDSAIAMFQKIIEIAPDATKAYNGLIVGYFDKYSMSEDST